MTYTLRIAHEAGKVSKANSKMPGTSFALSAKRCNVGSRLVKIKGSVCHKCYALRIQNFRPNVDKAWELNYSKLVQLLNDDPKAWVASMVKQIKGQKHHRWFDSSDLYNEQMLDLIVEVCNLTKDTQHWLPTREVSLIHNYNKPIPSNLIIRVSSPMINDKPLSFSNTSTVVDSLDYATGHVCPSTKQGNKCLDCRACWDKSVKNVTYIKH